MEEPSLLQSLVARARKGDRAAFDRLIETHAERVRSFIASRIKFHIGPRIELDDIVQETVARACEAIPRFQWKGEESFFRWLCGIAKHALLDEAEKLRKSERVEEHPGISADAVPPSKAMRREERFERLQKALEELPPDHRQVLILARLQGLKIKEIARRLSRSPDSVKRILSKALMELRGSFGDTESLHLPQRSLQLEGDEHGST